MNLLHLLGEHPLRVVLVALVSAGLVVTLAGVGRWWSAEHRTAAPSPAAAATSTPPPAPAGASPTATADPAQAEPTALAFCRQYFASSWQESPAQEQARVAPYLTARALDGWRDQLTPAEISARQIAKVTSCTVTEEGPAPGAQLGFFLDAQVVTTSTAGSHTGTAAAEVFLAPQAGAWKVDQVRT